MEKVNRIDASTLVEAVNKIAEQTTEFEWNGMSVVVNRTLPMETMLEFVDYVVKTCFSDDGEYLISIYLQIYLQGMQLFIILILWMLYCIASKEGSWARLPMLLNRK